MIQSRMNRRGHSPRSFNGSIVSSMNRLPDWSHLVLYGGTFDPPHLAHIELPRLACRAVGAQGVLYMPAGRPPHKSVRRISDAHHRLSMLKLALAGADWAAISTWEMERPQVSFTFETLEYLRQALGEGVRIHLLIGGDMAATFHQWREPARILELAQPLVMLRPPHDRDWLLARLPQTLTPQARQQWEKAILPLPAMDESSTELRALLATGRYQDPAVAGHLSPAVVDYVRENRLYESPSGADSLE